MINFVSTYWVEILLGLVSAGALGVCKYLLKQVKNYKHLLAEKDDQEVCKMIDEKLEPILAEIEELRNYIRRTEDLGKKDITLIISSYRFRLIQLCKIFIQQGYMTQEQYDQLTEFYKLYIGLGGNGQAKEYYEKTIVLPIKSNTI